MAKPNYFVKSLYTQAEGLFCSILSVAAVSSEKWDGF